jgi:membrane protein
MSKLTEAKSSATSRWAELQRKWPWLAHVLRAWAQLKKTNGTQYSAAITYFSFLALFPLLLLAVAVTGFVLASDHHLQKELFDKITEQIPGTLGTQLKDSLSSLIDARTGVGIIGLVGVLLTGLGWIGNLRMAIDAVWGRTPPKRNFFMGKLANLFVLAGLGLGVVLSLGLTVVGTSLTAQILGALDLDGVPGVYWLTKIIGIAIALLGDMIIFGWVLVRLPAMPVKRGDAIRGVLLAAVGFEVLKVVGTYTIAKSAHSPTIGPFGGLLAVLIWIELVSRFLLFCAAFIATAPPEPPPIQAAVPAGVVEADRRIPVGAGYSPLGVAASLVAVGAAAGAGALVWVQRQWRGSSAE